MAQGTDASLEKERVVIHRTRVHLRKLLAAPNFPAEDREVLVEHLLRGLAQRFGAVQANAAIRDFGLNREPFPVEQKPRKSRTSATAVVPQINPKTIQQEPINREPTDDQRG